jgi:hypothetical protein
VDIRTLGTPASWTVWKFDGALSPRIPLNMGSFVALVGGMQMGGTTPFGSPSKPRAAVLPNNLNPVIAVRGPSNPAYIGNIFIPSHPYEAIRLSSKDAVNPVDNVLIENVATTTTSPAGGSPLRIDNGATNVGGFGYSIRDSSFSVTGGTGAYPSIAITTAAIGAVSNTIVIGSGIRLDGTNFVAGGINGKWSFIGGGTDSSESLPTPYFMVDGTGGAAEQFDFIEIELSDNIQPANSLICNLSGTSVNSFTVINSRGWGGALTSGDNILGIYAAGGGANSGTANIGTGAGLNYVIVGKTGNLVVNSTTGANFATFGGPSPLAGIATSFQQSDPNTIAVGVRALATNAVDLIQAQDSTGAALVGIGRTASTDRLRVYVGGVKSAHFDAFGDIFARTDAITGGAPVGGLNVGASNSIGMVIAPSVGSQDSLQIFHTGSSTSKIFAVDSGDNTLIKRVKASQGTALGAGDFALSAGWGAGATVTGVTGTDQGWQMTVTAAGTPAANPSVTLTFKDGTWTNAPICVSKMVGGTGGVTPLTEAPAATANTLTFQGTPVAASTYILASVCMGR